MIEKKHEEIFHPLPPFYNESSRILILGSFPSVKTREAGFFYGNPQNRFWKILEGLFEEQMADSMEGRKEFLTRHGIALWDVIASCEIIGSSDASIQNVVPTDLQPILQQGNIKAIFCNGNSSYTYYVKYHEKVLQRQAVKLPSSSPANARMRLSELIDIWKGKIQGYI